MTTIALSALLLPAAAFAGKFKHSFDTAGRLVATDYGGGKVTTYTYDPNGNLLNRATVVATNADVGSHSGALSHGSAAAGTTVTFSFTFTNKGPHLAPGVTISIPLDFGLVLLGATTSQGSISVSNRTVVWQVGVLPVASNVSVAVSFRAGLTNTYPLQFTIQSSVPDPVPGNNATAVQNHVATAPADDDGDGMPTWWENLYGLLSFGSFGTNNPNGALHDRDGDGVTNFDEWLADTNPNDFNSFFHISAVGHEGNVTALEFQSSPIRRYRAQYTPDLNTPMTNFMSFDGTGGVISILHTNGSGGFYRLQAEVP